MCICGSFFIVSFLWSLVTPSHFFVFINRTCAGIHDLGLSIFFFSLLLLLVVLIGRCCILFVMPSFSSFFFFCSHILCIKRLLVVNRRHLNNGSYLHVLDCARFWVVCVYVVSLSSDRMDLVIHLLRYFSFFFFYSPPSNLDTRQSNIVIHTATREIAFFSFSVLSYF